MKPDPLRDVDAWLDRFRSFWAPPLEALATELARGRRATRLRTGTDTGTGTTPGTRRKP